MSKQRRIFVYHLSSAKEKVTPEPTQINVAKWRPGLTRFMPPNTSISYLFCWFAHFLGFFKSRAYCAFVLYEKNRPVCSLICVPALYRWAFMKRDDLQIKNVFTCKEYRGRGLAFALVKHVIQKMSKDGRSFWYMTHENNIPSQKLSKKVGFRYFGDYKRTSYKFFFYRGEVIQKENDLLME